MSRVIHHLAGDTERTFRYVSAYLICLAGIQVLTIGLSLAHITISQPVAIAIVLVSFILGLLQARSLKAGSPGTPIPDDENPAGIWLCAGFALLGALFYALLWGHAYLKPDLSWDGNAYHLATIHFWAVKGYVHWIEPEIGLGTRGIEPWLENWVRNVWNGFPHGVELTAYVLVKATGNSHFVNCVNLVYVPLGVLSLILITRLLGGTANTAVLAGVAFLFLPVNVQQAATTLVDTGYTATVLAGAAVMMHVLVQFRESRVPWKSAVPLGAAMGLTLGAKLPAPGFVAIGVGVLAAVAALVTVSQIVRSKRRAGLPAETPPDAAGTCGVSCYASKAVTFLLLVGGISLAVGGYWYGRNFLHTGNPLWPAKISVGEHDVFPGIWTSEDLDSGNFSVVDDWTQGVFENPPRWPASIRQHKNEHGGVGFLWAFGCIPAIGALLCVTTLRQIRGFWCEGRGSDRETLFWGLFAFVAGALLVMPGTARFRYVLWLYGLGLPSFFLVAQWILGRGRWWARPWLWLPRLWVFACVGILLFEGAYCLSFWATRSYRNQEGWPEFHVDPVVAARSLVWHDPIGYQYPSLSTTIFEDILTGTDAVAITDFKKYTTLRLIIGQLSLPIGARAVHFLDYDTANDREALETFLRKHRIRYLLWDYYVDVPKPVLELAREHEECRGKYQVFDFAGGPS